MPPAAAELKLVLGSAGASPSRSSNPVSKRAAALDLCDHVPTGTVGTYSRRADNVVLYCISPGSRISGRKRTVDDAFKYPLPNFDTYYNVPPYVREIEDEEELEYTNHTLERRSKQSPDGFFSTVTSPLPISGEELASITVLAERKIRGYIEEQRIPRRDDLGHQIWWDMDEFLSYPTTFISTGAVLHITTAAWRLCRPTLAARWMPDAARVDSPCHSPGTRGW